MTKPLQPAAGQAVDSIQSEAVREYAANKARTTRFTCGAPRCATLLGDGERMLFLRSDGSEDTVTALWVSVNNGTDAVGEFMLADPRTLLADADAEDVPAEERARRERARESGSGIVAYSVDDAGRTVLFTINGELFVCELGEDGVTAETRRLELTFDDDGERQYATPILNPRVSPDGTRVAYATGTAVVVAETATGRAHAVFTVAEQDRATMRAGLAEFAAAEEMDRYSGFWWGPDSRTLLVECFDSAAEPLWTISDPANPADPGMRHRYPRALTQNAVVDLFAVHLADDRLHVDRTALVDWDNTAYEYLAVVRWQAGQRPLLRVLNRLQTDEQILRVDVPEESGWAHLTSIDEHTMPLLPVSVLETHHNDQWIDLIDGTPAYTPDGRLICSVNDMRADTNRLTVDGVPFTPAGWQVRALLDADDGTVMCVVQRAPELAPDVPDAWRATTADHDARSFDVVAIDYEGHVYPVTDEPGVWGAARRGDGVMIAGRDMAHPQAQMMHYFRGNGVHVKNHAAVPGLTMNVRFVRLGERGLHAAIVAPTGAQYAGARQLPVLMHPYGGPGFQEVTMSMAAYWDAQWWAEQGYLVVVADGRGTTGRGPRWDREIHECMKDVTLADQVDAVHALADAVQAINTSQPHARHAHAAVRALPEPDLERVAMIGWSYGGFLSALAVLRAPDVFAAACAGAPPTDWTLYDTCYTERYLGLDPEVYARNSIIADAPRLRRPLMLIHGFADDNVTIAHSLRLSQALMEAGREHTFLPLTGITHMTNDPAVARNLLVLQRDFLARALAR